MRVPPAVCLLLLLPGCVGADDPAEGGPPTPPTGEVHEDRRLGKGPTEPAADRPEGAAAPELPVGRAWTYAGTQLYNPDPEWAVVVTEATAQGYLFAGGAEDDLVYDALWASEWYGPHARDLSEGDYAKPFDWPLQDGKSWTYARELTVTARAADVKTPRGMEPGFVVEGQDDVRHVRYEYAPSVGYYVRFLYEAHGEVFEDFELKAVADNVSSWVWYERGPLAMAPNPHEPAAFDVAAGWDALLVSAGGEGGGRALVAPPQGEPWRDEFAGGESWHHATLPATEGKWVASVQGRPWIGGVPPLPVDPPIGWAHVNAAPVRWLRPG